MSRVLALWCMDWPAVAAASAAGLAATDPIAVTLANRVIACSASARAVGVRRGLRRREAQARCPQLYVSTADPARDARHFEDVTAAVEQPDLLKYIQRSLSRLVEQRYRKVMQ